MRNRRGLRERGRSRHRIERATSAAELGEELRQLALRLVTDLTQPDYLALTRIVVAETPRDPSLAETFREAIAGRVLSSVADVLAPGSGRVRWTPV